jgi:hypothetical protein
MRNPAQAIWQGMKLQTGVGLLSRFFIGKKAGNEIGSKEIDPKGACYLDSMVFTIRAGA